MSNHPSEIVRSGRITAASLLLPLILCAAPSRMSAQTRPVAAEPAVGALTLEPATATLVVPGWLARAEAANRRRGQDVRRAALPDKRTPTADADFLAPPLAAPRRAETTSADDAPAAFLPADDARPSGDAVSGFAPTIATPSGYSHAAFAADMLAAPARAVLAAETSTLRPGGNDARAIPDRAPQTFAGPVWAATPAAAFVPAAYDGSGSASRASATRLPAAVGPLPAGANGVSGAAYGWGLNTSGQLGNGTTANATSPTAVSNLGSGVTGVASSAIHSLFIVNGAVYGAGYNLDGELGNGTISASGTYTTTPVPAVVLTGGVTAIATGYRFSLAIQNGALYTFGQNPYGQLGNGASGTNVPTPTAVSGFGSGVTLIAGALQTSFAVRGGALLAAGANGAGQLGNGTVSGSPTAGMATTFVATNLTSGVTGISARYGHALAIQNGAAYAWGLNVNGQLGNGTINTANGTPTVVLGLSTGVTSVAAGYGHSLAVQNGSVFAWGNNQTGQLGQGTNTGNTAASGVYSPVQVDPTDLKNIIAVSAGDFSSYALSADGSLWVWGRNNYGQLGLGNTTEYDSPQHLLPPSGYYYSAVDADSGGGGSYGQVLAILTPGTPVPEPSTWLGGALLVGAAGLTLRRRSQRA